MSKTEEYDSKTTLAANVTPKELCRDPRYSNLKSCFREKSSTTYIFVSIANIFGIVGLIFAIFIILRMRNIERGQVIILLMALVVSNLFAELATGPITLNVYAHDLEWQGGQSLCSFHGFAMVFSGVILPLTFLLISIERVVAVKCKVFYTRNASTKTAFFAVTGVFTFSMIFSTLPFMGFGSYSLQHPGTWCFLTFHSTIPKDSGFAYAYAILNILILLAMICCNGFVVHAVIKFRRRRLTLSGPSAETQRQAGKNSEIKVVILITAMTVLFSLCWLPLSFNILISQLTDGEDRSRDLITIRLIVAYLAVDPWLFVILRAKRWCFCLCTIDNGTTTIGQNQVFLSRQREKLTVTRLMNQ